MAAFFADVKLDLFAGPAERQLHAIEFGIDKVEAASCKILEVDKGLLLRKANFSPWRAKLPMQCSTKFAICPIRNPS